MKPLSPESRSLIDEVTAFDVAPPELEQEIMRRLSAKLQSQPSAAGPHALRRAADVHWTSGALVKLLIGAIALGSVSVPFAVRHSQREGSRAAQLRAAVGSAEPPLVAASDGTPQLPGSTHPPPLDNLAPSGRGGSANDPQTEGRADIQRSPSIGRSGGVRESASSQSLAEETQLLAAAQRALQNSSPKEAWAWIDKHAQRFPSGALAQERDAMRVFTLCALKRKPEARQAQQNFSHDWPASPLKKRVNDACMKP